MLILLTSEMLECEVVGRRLLRGGWTKDDRHRKIGREIRGYPPVPLLWSLKFFFISLPFPSSYMYN
jgi:hypothetical protein